MENTEEKSKREELWVFKSKRTNIKVTVYSYTGKAFSEICREGEEENITKFNNHIEELNSMRVPEVILPKLPSVSFYLHEVGPFGEYELYFNERTGIKEDDFQYRRLYRLLKFYLKEENLALEIERELIKFIEIKKFFEEKIKFFPIEWIEKENWE